MLEALTVAMAGQGIARAGAPGGGRITGERGESRGLGVRGIDLSCLRSEFLSGFSPVQGCLILGSMKETRRSDLDFFLFYWLLDFGEHQGDAEDGVPWRSLV